MSKSLKSLKIFEYHFQRFLGSKKTDFLYRDLLNNIFNIYIFEYLSRVGFSQDIKHKKKRKGYLLKFSKIRFFGTYLLEGEGFVSLSALLKDFQRTQRFAFWWSTWI
jgi:hypothetical protein